MRYSIFTIINIFQTCNSISSLQFSTILFILRKTLAEFVHHRNGSLNDGGLDKDFVLYFTFVSWRKSHYGDAIVVNLNVFFLYHSISFFLPTSISFFKTNVSTDCCDRKIILNNRNHREPCILNCNISKIIDCSSI